MSIELANGNFQLSVHPRTGGSIAIAQWKGEPILHRRKGDCVLDLACFPLVPFSNRIAGSCFSFNGRRVSMTRNHPTDPHCPVLHGFGWLHEWEVSEVSGRTIALSLDRTRAEWPWAFASTLAYWVSPNAFIAELGIENRSHDAMPVGLGFHPYFPRNENTQLHALHAGEWQTDANRIPTHLECREQAIDWWHGRPVETRNVDTVYTARKGRMTILWPDRGIGARVSPSQDLGFTTIYVPENEDYFCAEPVSHMTDAFNRERRDSGMRILAPGERWKVSMHIEAFDL